MKNTFKLIGLALVASALAFATSCEKDEEKKDEEKKDTTVAVTGVTLDLSSKTLTVGGTFTLTATVAPKDATDATVEWKSSSTATASVTNGVVTAVAAGATTITVTTKDGGKTATCVVTVTAASEEPEEPTLAAPTGLNVVAVSLDAATVTWTAVNGASSYGFVKHGEYYNDTLSSRKQWSTPLSENTYAWEYLQPNTSYTYSVRAENDDTVSVWVTGTFTTAPVTELATPTGLRAAAAHNAAQLNWDYIQYASSYEVVVDNNAAVTVVDYAYKVTSLQPSSAHTFKVRALADGGVASEWSEVKDFTTTPVPSAGATFTVTRVESGFEFAGLADNAWTAVAYMTTYDDDSYYGSFKIFLYAFDYNTVGAPLEDYMNCGYLSDCYNNTNAAMVPYLSISLPPAATATGSYNNSDEKKNAAYFYAYDAINNRGQAFYDVNETNGGIEVVITTESDETVSGTATVKLKEVITRFLDVDPWVEETIIASATLTFEFSHLPKASGGVIKIE
jgi:hypothetical protein